MTNPKPLKPAMENKITTPKAEFQVSVCPVCGGSYDYHGHKPRTCKDFNCRYTYDNDIMVHKWAHIPRSKAKIAERQAAND